MTGRTAWVSDVQFFADQVDQMDLALDQLALKDRNFDRFALLLIDNVVELTLHRHAEHESRRRSTLDGTTSKAIATAKAQHFEQKVKLAKVTGLVSPELADSITYLHSFRNTAHHAGQRHEGILHSLALFYFTSACEVLSSNKGSGWSATGADVVPHRALKYLGYRSSGVGFSHKAFQAACVRLTEVARSMGDALVSALHDDMMKTVVAADEAIQFVAVDSPQPLTRRAVIIQAQTWAVAWTDEAKSYAASHMPVSPMKSVGGYIDWLASNYPWPAKTDPIPSWRKRLGSIEKEKDHHLALKKYCDFMNQTESLRSAIFESAAGLDAHIQQQIDEARGK